MTIIFGIVSLSCAGFVLLWALSGSRQAAEGPELANTHKKELQTSGLQRVMLPVLSKLGRHIARMLPPGRIQALRRRIVLGGKQMTWNVEKAMALKALGAAVGVAAASALLS